MSTDALYPFLAAPGSAAARDPAALLADVARSTREKLGEIERVRAAVLERDDAALAVCATAMADQFARGGRLHVFGNGGSSTDALAVASLFTAPGPGWRPLPAMALPADVATLTALANDVSFDVVFARPLAAAGRPEDVALGLSTSGGSTNVLRGLEVARDRGLLTVALAGAGGGAMAEAAGAGRIEHLFVMPSSSVHRIQEAQTTVYQVLWELVQLALGAADAERGS
ncbi:MAG: SIS domain-containing protein [Pseudonocardia sp.]|nr:SIS domain-containing protein [Pseudonocardia sp.]